MHSRQLAALQTIRERWHELGLGTQAASVRAAARLALTPDGRDVRASFVPFIVGALRGTKTTATRELLRDLT